MIRNYSYFFFTLLLFIPGISYSADYQWSARTLKFSTPELACRSYEATVTAYLNRPATYLKYTLTNPTSARCQFSAAGYGSEGFSSPDYYSYRTGDTCPAGLTLNPLTGACEGDPCKQKEGQTQQISKSGFKNDGFYRVTFNQTLKKNFYFTSSTACFAGCAIDIARKLSCTMDIAGQYRCSGAGTHKGTTCSSENPSSDPDPEGTDPQPEQKTSEEPCVYGTGPDGVTSCEYRKKIDSDGIFSDRAGDSDCASSDGCNGNDPKSDEDKIETKITSKTNSDGTIETTKTDTKTVTKCASAETNCTTSTTTKTTTTKTDANGNVTSVNGKCSGAQCTSNTNPDGNGDGFGDCVGDDCGDEEEGGSTVAGESCDVALTCEGDAIQCAILRQEKENNCKWRLGAPEEAQIVAQLEGEGFELEENDVDTGSMFSDALAQGRWLSGSCPAPRTVNVMGTTLSFSWEPVCQFAISMGPLIVAMASLFFALYVFRGVKGS